MNATEQASPNSGSEYKTLLLEARTLRGKVGVYAWRRIKILCHVFADKQFREDCGNIDDFKAAAVLDDYVDDLCMDFLEAKMVLESFPKRKQWADGRLHRLYREAMKLRDKQLADQNNTQPGFVSPRKPATAETKKRLEKQLDAARHDKVRHGMERDRMEARIAELEAEVIQLKSRIHELEDARITEAAY